MSQVKITLIPEKCVGCSACAGLVSNVFVMENGIAQIKDGEAVEGQEGAFYTTVENDNPMINALQGMCPGQAILVEAV